MSDALARRTADHAAPVRDPGHLNAIHLGMLDAVVAGAGLPHVADIAATELDAAVAVVVPALSVATAAPDPADPRLRAVRHYVANRAIEHAVEVPDVVTAEAPIVSAGRRLGAVVLLGPARAGAPVTELLQLAAAAAVTAVAIEESAEDAAARARATLIQDARAATGVDPSELLARARRLGCDLAAGGIALSADLGSTMPGRARALVLDTFPDALVDVGGQRLSALLPARPTGPAATLVAARRTAARLPDGVRAGLSRFAGPPVDLRRALGEADIVRRLGTATAIDPPQAGGTYGLLISTALSSPRELEAFRDETIGPALAHDDRLGADLLATFAAYLRHGCNMNATAHALHAHRHTVSYRLGRLNELTGLDPHDSEDRERLGVALKAAQILDALGGD